MRKGLRANTVSPGNLRLEIFFEFNILNLIGELHSTCAPIRSINSTISSARQTVVRGPSFTGLGKRPVLQPSHQALLLMGTSCRTWGSRRKPTLGMLVMVVIVTPPDRSLVFAGSVSRLFWRAVLYVKKYGLGSYWMALHCTMWTNFLLAGFDKSMFLSF